MNSQALPVRAGDRVEFVGTVVRSSAQGSVGVGIADDTGPGPVVPDLQYPPISVVVAVLGPGGHQRTWQDLIGRRVRARGTWTGDGLMCDPDTGDVSPVAPLLPAEPERAWRPEHEPAANHVEVGEEEALLATGDIIWRVSFERGGMPVVLVAAHDAPRVERLLRPVHGEALQVVQSPWSREQYLLVDWFRDMADAQGLLISIERGLDLDDGVVRAAFRLTALTDELAAHFALLPTGLATLEAWVAPQDI